MLLRLFINLNNRLAMWRSKGVASGRIVLLLPRCLHKDTCDRNVMRSLDECRRCGQCSLSKMAEIREKFGIKASVVGGGHHAAKLARQKHIGTIVAVACEKELLQGILSVFPKPVVAIANTTPNGPCKNTLVDEEKVAETIAELLSTSPFQEIVDKPEN